MIAAILRKRILSSAMLHLFLAFPLAGETLRCSDPVFRAVGANPEELEQTCEAASRARQRLASCGGLIERPVDIHISDYLEGELGEYLGEYLRDENKIRILSHSAMRKARDKVGAFSQISDQAFWEGVLTHELTHTAYDGTPCPYQVCIATSEYSSYAMQVWTLPKTERDKFAPGVKPQGVPNREAINAMMLYFSPDRFALISWFHFNAQPDQCEYMRKIMRGDVIFDNEPL